MGLELMAHIDEKQLADAMRLLKNVRGGFQRAAYTAINQTLKTGRKNLLREMVPRSGLTKKALLKVTKIYPARANKLSGKLRLQGHRVPIFLMKARQTMKGVTYKGIEGARSLIPSAFIATMPNPEKRAGASYGSAKAGHTGAMVRRGPTGYPIKEALGPSPWLIYKTFPTVQKEGEQATADLFAKNFKQKVDWLTEKN